MTIAKTLKIKHTILDFRSPMHVFPNPIHIMMHAGVREGQSGEVETHRLPFGAGMVLSVAASYAVYNRIFDLVWGATKDDRGLNRQDYTKEFANSISSSVNICVKGEFKIHTPFSELHKFEVISKFIGSGDIFSQTWSCSGDAIIQCGTCHACVARRIASGIAKIPDQTPYGSSIFENPFTAEEMNDPSKIDDDRYVGILNCEDKPF